MDDNQKSDAALDKLFEAGKAQIPLASEAFLARLEADMKTHTPIAAPKRQPTQTSSFYDKFKGLFAASGLSGAAALGVWIGFIMPDLVTEISPIAEDVTTLSAFLPGSDLSVLSE